jgi:MoxR-like ATPase
VLADEINRAPPKVQSALLEAMAEQQISAGGQTRPLPELFLVLATQNPLEQAGTYPLPEAQLDRFLFHVPLDYPSADDELAVVQQARLAPDPTTGLAPLVHPDQVLAARRALADIHIDGALEKYAVDLVQATRRLAEHCPEWPHAVRFGASPRGAIALLRAASALAALSGRDYVIPDDLIALAPDVLRHRLILDYQADAEGLDADRIIQALLERLPAP